MSKYISMSHNQVPSVSYKSVIPKVSVNVAVDTLSERGRAGAGEEEEEEERKEGS